MEDRIVERRQAYAAEITRRAGVRDPRIEKAFAAVPREYFAGPPPWRIGSGGLYGSASDDDPISLYEDVLVAIDAARGINNGQPSLHALCIDALGVKEGETIVHVGAGAGYYTAILAKLVRTSGRVIAYEVETDIAERARANLARLPSSRGARPLRRRRRAARGRRDLRQRRRNASRSRLARRAEGRWKAPLPAPGGAFDRRHAVDYPARTGRRLAGAVLMRGGVHRLRRRPGPRHRPSARRGVPPRRRRRACARSFSAPRRRGLPGCKATAGRCRPRRRNKRARRGRGASAGRICVAKNRRHRRPSWRRLASCAHHSGTSALRMPWHSRSRAAR